MFQKKVLIIDDDPKNIFALVATLRAKGFETLTATHAADGIEMLKTDSEIGVVLLDMMMPDMDGYETLHHLRRDKEIMKRPVIAVTAQAMKGDREKCIEAGADGYISKPIDVDALMNILQQYITK